MKTFEESLKEIEKDILGKSRSRRIAGMEAKDIYQELYIELSLRFKKFDPKKSSFRTWANMIMRNKLIDLWRKSENDLTSKNTIYASELKLSRRDEGEGILDVFEEVVASDGGIQVERMENSIDSEIAFDKANIPESNRTILELYSAGYNFKEIGKKVKRDEKTISRRIKRSLKKLRENI